MLSNRSEVIQFDYHHHTALDRMTQANEMLHPGDNSIIQSDQRKRRQNHKAGHGDGALVSDMDICDHIEKERYSTQHHEHDHQIKLCIGRLPGRCSDVSSSRNYSFIQG
jgi:hypothetical protein